MKVFSTDNAKAASVMKTEVQQYVKSAALSELMRVKDKKPKREVLYQKAVKMLTKYLNY